ncbi:MAG: hypothetical protein RMJ15_06920 [Nitrososphaerota archaeon]|nr:hypothetical protein [Candidatus Bathyarchaeota archaeon]MDW8023450.1 hypothetical protein [Nitrososphaerota archaeon]
MNYQETALKHYSKGFVQKEIADFCRGKWTAVHCMGEGGNLIFRRYLDGKPITINDASDVSKLLSMLSFKLRSIYATANVYSSMEQLSRGTQTFYDASLCTPTWDLDGPLSSWRETITVAREIVSFLESQGIEKSVYIKWSGNGCHVHIHEQALSRDILSRAHPLDFAYAIVEYVNLKLSPKIVENFTGVRVENRMDAGRVFTCPLSLHRTLDVVCVCMKPNELDAFSPEWIQPLDFKHNVDWREFKKGEADELALKAYSMVGGYSIRRNKRRVKRLDEQINEWLQRF